MRLTSIRCLTFTALVTLVACGGGGGSSAPPPSTAPTISGVGPTHGSPGATVAITGTNLFGTSAVSFNGTAAFSYTVMSSIEVDAVVPGNATTGTIQVTTLNGTATSLPFTVDAASAPTIASFSPSILSVGSVATLTGTHFVGATQVKFNGVNASAFTVTNDTQIQATAPSGLTAGTITVTTTGGTATSSTSYTVSTAIQVLMNTGFEQTSPVIWQGDTGIIQDAPGSSNPSVVPHTGTQFAWLGGYGAVVSDQITQDLYIPATAQSATLTFYLKIITAETGGTLTDTMTVSALNPSGAVLGTLLAKSNLDASAYTAYSVDLLPYNGQTIRLSFKSLEDAQNATSFLLDDVVANIAVPIPADLRPVILSFTPASGIAGEVAVQITGGNFFGLTGVTIGGASATYTLRDGTSLSATVPATAATGSAPISITNAQGTGASNTNFTTTIAPPTITAVNPTQAPVGANVVITGTYLGNVTLALNGANVPITSQSATQLNFTVPVGALSGNLVVTNPGGTATHAFTVNNATATLDLHIEKVQLTQSTQTLDNAVPIVAGKSGLIRVFVLANQTNTGTAPSVQVTLRNNGTAVPGYPKTIPAPSTSVPTALNESSLSASWNVAVAGTDLTTPTGTGYSVQAMVDPTNAIAEADEFNNTATVSLSGTTVPTFKTTIFPVVLSSGTGNVTEGNKAAWVARLAKMYPVASVDVVVGAAFTASISTLTSDQAQWSQILIDLATKHQADAASDRYYYGALNVSYDSGIAGLGYVPPTSSYPFSSRTAIGWDKATGYSDGGNFPEVFAHETGHNMGRQHSPCGGAASPDPNYPYAGGLIGVWGYDSVSPQLYSPTTTKDIMAYCTPVWVSDYVYKKILDFRGGTGGFLTVGAEDAPLPKAQSTARECLIVRGIVHQDGKVEMLPSFRTSALPSALPSEGDYTLEGRDSQGQAVFSTPIELMELGCWPKGHERHFVMALPLDAAVLDSIAGLAVLKDGQLQTSLYAVSAAARSLATAPEVHRLAEDRMQFTWDASIHPAVMLRDADSGEVVAILSGGRQTIPTSSKRFDLVLSDGVTGKTHRLEIKD